MDGERIRKYRETAGYTQENLASELGISRQTVALIEGGRYNPSLKICLKMAQIFGRSLDDLFGSNGRDPLENEERFAVVDIGSTATKAVLLVKEGKQWVVAADAYVRTTVEDPENDVTLGISAALREIDSRVKGKKIISAAGKPSIPLLATSSAGGGLQIAVFGISSTDTGELASQAANGAGGVILRRFTIDDELPVIERMRFLRDIHPDMILMAGGIDGGNIAGVVRLAEILALSEPSMKYAREERPPVVFAGNTNARDLVTKTLEGFECHVTENIRPSLEKTNIFPAQASIHHLFLNHVMEKAPGYPKLKKWAGEHILPTPVGVEKILSLYGEMKRKNVVMADMGGATTDIFSNIIGEYNRTVAANIGMSYSLGQIFKEAGEEKVSGRLEAPLSCDIVRQYCGNKMLYPTRLPDKEWKVEAEQHMAVLGLQLAWQQHQKTNFRLLRVGFLDRRRRDPNYDPFSEVLSIRNTPKSFQFNDIDLFIGSGGVLSHTRQDAEAIHMLLDGFLPEGITTLAVDKGFRSPHFGILSTLAPTEALDAFVRTSLKEIAYVLAPTGRYDEKKSALTLIREEGAVASEIAWGSLLFYPQGLQARVIPAKNVSLDKNGSELTIDSALPVVIDCRGRGRSFNGRPFTSYVSLYHREEEPGKEAPEEKVSLESDITISVPRRMPYKGEVLVAKGDQVVPGTPVGENNMTPPRIFMVDLRRLLGYDIKAENEELLAGITVKEDDIVSTNETVFDGRISKKHHVLKTPVRGRILAVEETGIIILEEIQDYSTKPVTIPVASLLNIRPRHLKGHLSVKEGEFIEKGMHLVKLSSETLYMRESPDLKAPVTGIVKAIDLDKGTVTLQYDFKPLRTHAFVRGIVKEIHPGYEALIETRGHRLTGRIGFGHEHWGELAPWETADKEGKILFLNGEVTLDHLRACQEKKARGLVAPAMDLSHWRTFFGDELGSAITGDEGLGFTLLVTRGFGEGSFSKETLSFLEKYAGETGSISGRTQIRAGVIRPFLLING